MCILGYFIGLKIANESILLLLQLCMSSCGDFIGCLQEYQANEDRQLTPNTLT